LFRDFTAGVVLSDSSLPSYNPLYLLFLCVDWMVAFAFLVAWLYVAALFLRRSIRLPRYFICIQIGQALRDWIAVLLAVWRSTGTSFVAPEVIESAIVTTVMGAIWIAYIMTSKRVERTFVMQP
jgi:hypothetical protein